MISVVKIFCSGIGGIGLSAYAAYQHVSGHEVSGSDRTESALINDLRSQGIDVSLTQDGSALPDDAELFVYTLALPEDHPELAKAKELNIPQKTYFEALGDLTNDFQLIAVAGTSGKSSTTAMAAKVLIDAGLDPSVILGTKTPDLDGKNWRKGSSNLFLVEACEYCDSFLNLSPNIALITNAYGDHFDAYSDKAQYTASFQKFLGSLPSNGALITHLSDPDCKKLTKTVSCTVLDADQSPVINLQVPGKHMQGNAQLVLALADHLDIKDADESLKSYRGCWRRMEVKGELDNGVLVIDDYGHHPNEVKVTLEGLKEHYSDRRLVLAFQPHTHDRTKKLYDQFLTAFKAADLVIIPNIFAARSDRDSDQVDPLKLIEDIKKGSSVEVIHGESIENTIKILQSEILQKNDLLVTMGAGDVWKVSDNLTYKI
jgi:UDP-N-acetylmuramate--alanine ligase